LKQKARLNEVKVKP